MTNTQTIDFTRFPYRGVFGDVARQLSRHRNTVRESYYRGSPQIVAAVKREIRKRERLITEGS